MEDLRTPHRYWSLRGQLGASIRRLRLGKDLLVWSCTDGNSWSAFERGLDPSRPQRRFRIPLARSRGTYHRPRKICRHRLGASSLYAFEVLAMSPYAASLACWIHRATHGAAVRNAVDMEGVPAPRRYEGFKFLVALVRSFPNRPPQSLCYPVHVNVHRQDPRVQSIHHDAFRHLARHPREGDKIVLNLRFRLAL